MVSQMGIVGICSASVAIVFVDNIDHGKDPFNALVAGGIFTGLTVGISEIDMEFGEAIAWVFLLSNVLLKSDSILNFFLGLTNSKSAPSIPSQFAQAQNAQPSVTIHSKTPATQFPTA